MNGGGASSLPAKEAPFPYVRPGYRGFPHCVFGNYNYRRKRWKKGKAPHPQEAEGISLPGILTLQAWYGLGGNKEWL